MRTLVMGVLDATPDSFSDSGRFLDSDVAIARGRALFEAGADIVDVGGESTRPGADAVPAAEEMRRVLPVVEGLAPHGRVSIDTMNDDVAERAVAAGADMINDGSAALHPIAADLGVAWVAMHMQGRPKTLQDDPGYDDVVGEVRDFLVARAEAAVAAGVPEVWIDPGLGFGKRFEHSMALLAQLDRLVATGYPIVVGASRKSFIGRMLATSDGAEAVEVSDRLEGSLAAATWAMTRGAAMVRVHDVAATVRAAAVVAGPEADAA